jgi:hypothetical protein
VNIQANAFRKHMPAFVELSEEPVWRSFGTLPELLALADVAGWQDIAGFRRFSQSDRLLMVEIDTPRGCEHWVAGSLREAVNGLPEWRQDSRDE